MLESVSTSNLAQQTPNQQQTSNAVTENIKCFVRCRPLNEKEKDLGAGCIKIDNEHNSIYVDNKADYKGIENKTFALDCVFDDSIQQDEIFERVAIPVLKGFLQGFNCTIFAYGQTGAGKTHTMLGPLEAIFDANSYKHGLIPRILQYIFPEDTDLLKKVISPDEEISGLKMDIKCSCLEIYQEQIIDLLNSNTNNSEESKLVIREDSKKGMFIDGLSEMNVKSDKSAKELIMLGLKNRHVAATNMNAESSRSHLIFTIFMNMSYSLGDGMIVSRSTRLHLIDLAGSERQKATKAVGERIKEAGMINKSLSTLGNVINALVEMSEGKTKYVPFRDSKLTHFLKDSLGGNAKTTIIANISQSVIQIQETISTLKFVQRAKMIKNKAVINENVNDAVKILQIEIRRLKEELQLQANKPNDINSSNYICQICKNQKENQNIKDESKNNNSDMDLHINNLITKVDNLFTYESMIIDKFRLIDTVASSSIEKFFIHKEIYENDYSKLINSLDKKVKQFTNMIKFKENILSEIKEELAKFNKNDIINNLFVEKINSFTDELISFKSDFEVNNLLSLTKLSEENKQLKNELEAMRYLKEYFSSVKDKKIEAEAEFYSKENVEKMSSVVGEFIETNRDIKTFFSQNLNAGRTDNILKLEDAKSEVDENGNFISTRGNFALIDKKEFERLKFQIEEFKINEDNNQKLIDDLQSENFLLNMELTKFKENKFNSMAQNFEKNSDISEEGKSFSDSDEERDVVMEEENNKVTSEFAEMDGNEINESISQNSKNYSTPMKKSIRDSNTENKNQFMKNLRASLLQSSPNKNMLRSSLLYSAKAAFSPNPTDSDPRPSVSMLTRENIELIKLKEKLDDVLLHLEEKNLEINQKDGKIEELLNLMENMKVEKDQMELTVRQLKDEIDTLCDTNSLLSADVIAINSQLNTLLQTVNECDVSENMDKITTLTEQMYQTYLNDIDYIKKFSSYFSKIKTEHTKLKSNLLKLRLMEDENKKLKTENEKMENVKKEELKSNLLEIKNIFEIIKEFKDQQMNNIEGFLNLVNDRLEKNEILLDRLKESIFNFGGLLGDNNGLREEINKLKEENEKFKTKIKNIFGNTFDIQSFLNDSTQNNEHLKIFNWDKTKLSKLEKKILQMKDEKKQLKADLALLHADFSKGLSDYSLNNKIQLLMRVKEENYHLKLELIELKKKNEILERNIDKLRESMDHILTNANHCTNCISVDAEHCHTPQQLANFEENIKLKKEHRDLIDKILELDIRHKVKDQSKFRQAMEILKNAQEVIELNKFHFNVKFGDSSGKKNLHGNFHTNANETIDNIFKEDVTGFSISNPAAKDSNIKSIQIGNKKNFSGSNKIKHEFKTLSSTSVNTNVLVSSYNTEAGSIKSSHTPIKKKTQTSFISKNLNKKDYLNKTPDTNRSTSYTNKNK